MKTFLFIISFLALTGCSTIRDLVVTEVKVPVPIPCHIVPPERPAMPLQDAKKEEVDPFTILQKALAEIELRIGYETKLEYAITECNK